jgi:hypothetical protein
MMDYSPEERTAAIIIASLIYPGYPGGPDLDTDSATLGLLASAVESCRDPYHMAAITMPLDGVLRDCPGDAATAWEGLRQMSSAMRPYAQLDPLIREIGGAIHLPPLRPAQPTNGNGAHKEYTVDWTKQGITLADLQNKEFPPERWIVEGIMPEGAVLFAAKYKSKKSWMVLAVGIAISMGGIALGRLPVVQGDVLYLDLEGRQQRIQKRTRAMLGVRQCQWPDNFTVFTKWRRGNEGLEDLEHWLMAHPNAAMIVVDVLASFRRPMEKHEGFYDYDRETVDPINALGEKYHVAIILVHHFNKGKHDDIMDSITGSTGLPSAVNTMWALRRDVNDSSIQVLELRGRDLENDEPLALKWDSYLNQHIIEGPAAEVAISHERKSILDVMSTDEPLTPKDIAVALGRPVETIKQLLRKMLNEGIVDKVGYGKYARIAKRDHSDHGGNSDHSDHSDHSSGESDRKSDRYPPRVIGDSTTDHSLSEATESPKVPQKDKSDRSDRYIREGDLFEAITPEGLTPAQWEQARYALALGHFSAFADVARSIPMDYHELKKLVEGAA